jgi:flagellar FliJ protein
MAKFDFKLEGVLRQRKHVEQEKQRVVAEKQKVLVEIQNQLRQLQEALQSTNEDVRKNHLVGRLNMDFIAAHRRFLAGMQRQGVQVMQRLALAQRALDEARLELAEAARGRKAIEKLREKQLERWRADQSRRELAEMDEIGMQLAYRRLAEGSADADEILPTP